MRYLKKEQIPFYIVGNGSNLLVRDEGVRGVVLQLGERFSGYEFLHETPGSVAQSGTAVDKNQIVMVRAKAGSLLGRLGKEFAEYSLSGFEFASGIPGTLGGAVYMNAGAYGGEIKDILVRATLMDMDGSLFEFTNQQMQFGYRKSIAAEKNYIVLEADLALHVSSKEEVLAKMAELSAQRTRSLFHPGPNAPGQRADKRSRTGRCPPPRPDAHQTFPAVDSAGRTASFSRSDAQPALSRSKPLCTAAAGTKKRTSALPSVQ